MSFQEQCQQGKGTNVPGAGGHRASLTSPRFLADHLLRNSCPRAVPLPRPRHPQMGGFCPECQQQPGLPVLPAGAGRLHRADAGEPGPGTAGPLHHRRRRPCPGLTRVPLRSHARLQLHTVPLGYLPPARLDGDHLWHPLPPAHPRPPSPRPLLRQGAPEKGLLAGRPCGEPRPRAVPGLAEAGQRGNCPALSRAQGLMPWMCPGQSCPILAPAQPHIGTWLLPSPAMGQTRPLDGTSRDT
ncbi:transmembrane protein 54 isoform X2 [Harpia harpyja]|uniref:transmembrane protein 54 isoform X2 n=1 Tax=Harpia harpyja TaxID=202280 RepID=UPI0022B179E1|nr:transmembrane protein 54 isoform X2 [Harpia harpyja]XP_052667670.1 transmembrane protein 54 isoform X2 [Harpia harpyja]XP_052667671.1 transmembrane protein 54 isoform X2 [Harpia harpyja]XP_052667672.1 transmembrane protein 54 isoform X2 [Harpia harpyja]